PVARDAVAARLDGRRSIAAGGLRRRAVARPALLRAGVAAVRPTRIRSGPRVARRALGSPLRRARAAVPRSARAAFDGVVEASQIEPARDEPAGEGGRRREDPAPHDARVHAPRGPLQILRRRRRARRYWFGGMTTGLIAATAAPAGYA